MTRPRAIALACLVAALGLLPVLFFSADGTSYGVYTPVGYVDTVDAMIRRGSLAYDCATDQVLTRELSSEEAFFYANSYLARDVAAWNGGDRRPFFVEREESAGGRCRGELVRANAGHHRQRLPSYDASGWRGRLFMHQEAAATILESAERTVEVTRPPLALLPLDASVYEDLWLGPDRPDDARSQKLALKSREAGRAFAALETIGDDATLEVLQSRPEMILNGCPVPRGTRVRLDSGDVLRLSDPPRLDERWSVDAGDRAGLLSFVSEVNGNLRRQTIARRLPMAGDLVRAIDTAVVSEAGDDRFDVHLTLDAYSNDLLTRRLEELARERYGRRPLRAAITLLDPADGRVLAAASYPTPASLDRLALRREGDRAALARNHNFLHHPVGSAAKPFLAAAALATRPALASLELRCFPGGEAPEVLLGLPLGRYNLPSDCAAQVGDESFGVDFTDFLRVSSNRYMLYLGLLSMADWQGEVPRAEPGGAELSPLDTYRVSGAVQTTRPRLPIVKATSASGTELGDVADQPFFRNLRRLFGLSYQYQGGGSARRLEREIWQPVLDQVPGIENDPEALLAFWPVTPEEVNLGANLVQSFRQDLYTMLLGLGDNRWSNLQLAQALGRLMTGDGDLRAQLVESVVLPAEDDVAEVVYSLDAVRDGSDDGATGSPAARPWPLSETARELVLRGMAAVVEQPGGTAGELRRPLGEINRLAPPGVVYRLYAKTGTPTTDPEILRRSGTTPAPGALVTYPGGVQAQSAMLLLGLERSAPGEPTERRALVFYVEGQGGSGEAVALAADVLRPLVEGTWPQDWLRPSS